MALIDNNEEMDNMMDELTLDGVARAPEFVDFPDGEYILEIKKTTMKMTTPKNGGKAYPRINIIYALVQVTELAKASDTPPLDGSLTSESFSVTQDGKPYLFSFLADLCGDALASSEPVKVLLESLIGMQVSCITSTRNGFLSTKRRQVV